MDVSTFRGETARLLLRPHTPDDFDAYHDLHSRDDVTRYLPWDTRDEEASRVALQRRLGPRLEKEGDAITLAGFEKESARFIGEFTLILRSVEHRGGEVGYVVHPDHQGRGLATEGAAAMLQIAFEAMGMHRVIARIDARNAGSAAVLDRLGMRREAVLVDNEWVKGEWSTEVDYALLEGEWASSPMRSCMSSNTSAPASASASADVSPPA